MSVDCQYLCDKKNLILLYGTFNDTIYNLYIKEGKYSITPQYVFDLGKYAAIHDARIRASKTFFAPKVFNPFEIMAKIELLGESERYILYKNRDKYYHFYDKMKHIVRKWQLIPEGKEDVCKENPDYFTLLCIDAGGVLLGIMPADNEGDNPVLVLAELK